MSVELPTVTITEAAARAFRAAAAEGADVDHVLRLSIDSRFQNDLFFGPRETGDVVVTVGGMELAMDASTARRADGLTIDYVEGRTGTGFKLENPNRSSPVKGILPADLVRLLEGDERFELVDVRSAEERAKATVDGFNPMDEGELLAMPKTRKLVFLAHHGRGGQAAAQRFFERGFRDVRFVVGGIDAWSTMDPSVPRY